MSGDHRTRVVFLHSSNEMYGADKILLEVLRALPAEDRRNSMVCLPDDLPHSQNGLAQQLDRMGISHRRASLPVIRRRYMSPQGLWPLLQRVALTWKLLRSERPNVVYCTTTAMVLCLPLAKIAGIRDLVLHVQEIWSAREGLVLGLFARSAQRIICISKASEHSLPAYLKTRSVLLTNAHRDSLVQVVPLEDKSPRLKFVVASRWNSWKGHETLLEAWNGDQSPGDLVILGGPPLMGIGVDVHKLAASVKHANHISLVGEVSDIGPYLDSADILILPSDRPEPFGLVLLEAFARGRCVVASNGGGATDIVTDGHNGRLFQLGSSEDLAACLFSLNRVEAQRMGTNARATYEEKYSIGAYGEKFREIWKYVCDFEIGRDHANS